LPGILCGRFSRRPTEKSFSALTDSISLSGKAGPPEVGTTSVEEHILVLHPAEDIASLIFTMAIGVLPVVGGFVFAFLLYAILFVGRREKGLPPGRYQRWFMLLERP
jgi:hypothetical protein